MKIPFRPQIFSIALIGAALPFTIFSGSVVAQELQIDDITTSSINPARFGTSDNCTKADTAEIAALVRSIATELDFDPDLAEAVAFVESGLGQNQTSGAGAVGIMQLMPGTASDLGVNDRCDAASNIRGGITYLKSLYDKFQDPLLMLAAYNAGAGRVYEKNGIPEFEETAKYVVKIMNRWKLNAKVKASNPSKIGLSQTDLSQASLSESDLAQTGLVHTGFAQTSLAQTSPSQSGDAAALSSPNNPDASSGLPQWKDNHVIELQ